MELLCFILIVIGVILIVQNFFTRDPGNEVWSDRDGKRYTPEPEVVNNYNSYKTLISLLSNLQKSGSLNYEIRTDVEHAFVGGDHEYRTSGQPTVYIDYQDTQVCIAPIDDRIRLQRVDKTTGDILELVHLSDEDKKLYYSIIKGEQVDKKTTGYSALIQDLRNLQEEGVSYINIRSHVGHAVVHGKHEYWSNGRPTIDIYNENINIRMTPMEDHICLYRFDKTTGDILQKFYLQDADKDLYETFVKEALNGN